MIFLVCYLVRKIAQQELELDNIYEECERIKKEDQVKIDKKVGNQKVLLCTECYYTYEYCHLYERKLK